MQGQGNVLVTGATGFTGGHLCERLTEAGYRVRALVRESGGCEALRRRGCEIVLGDLRDRESLARAAKGSDVIYHMGAMFRKDVARKAMWEVNVDGTRNLLEAGVQAGVKRFRRQV